VKEDSDAPCKLLGDENAIRSCRATRSVFHELRAYPNGRAFMFNDVQFEDCKNFKPLAPYCEKYRAAARAGDAGKCDALGELQSNCRAAIKLDKSLCTAPKGEAFQGRDEGRGLTFSDSIREDCQQQVESMTIYAQGLQAVADSGPARERQFAKAAQRQADACTPFSEAAATACNGQEPRAEAKEGKPEPGATPEKKPPS
jgi:hypothetical protein